MIFFVTVGTHPGGFDRLIRHMDKIAGLLKESYYSEGIQ